MDNINNYSREMSPEELLEIRAEVLKRDSGLHDFTGIYVLENKTVDKFYVGQSISLFKRCGAHFTGEGNKDIYEDYSNGEIWTVRLIALADSGFKSINALDAFTLRTINFFAARVTLNSKLLSLKVSNIFIEPVVIHFFLAICY